MMQVEARPSIAPAGGRAATRRPIRIVAPTASGRRWRTGRRAGEPSADAHPAALDPIHFASFLAAFEPR